MQDFILNYYKIVSGNIKNLRLSLHLSQEKFAESVSCSREYISRLENNKERISLMLLLSICQVYKLKPEDLFKVNN